jgi:hypothetical protein
VRVGQVLGSDSGATLAIVVVTMMALFGMTVLVVDVGGLLSAKRRMVTASDSAALAAAQSCARMHGSTTAKSQADFFATENVSGATAKSPTEFSPSSCGTTRPTSSEGSVSVAYEFLQDLFFGPVLGTDEEASVLAKATAIWGPTGRAVVIPLELTLDSVANAFTCTDSQDVGEECFYYYDNGANNLPDSSNWGFMNLDTWPTSEADNDPNAGCSNAGVPDMGDWLTGTVEVEGQLYPPHTYVCVQNGAPAGHPNWSELVTRKGDLLYFPINDPDAMVLSPPGKAKYAIVGFAPLRLVDVLFGTDATGSPPGSGICSETHTFRGRNDDDDDDDRVGGNDRHNISPLLTQCAIANDADAVLEPPVLKRTNGTTIPQGGHWRYDADTNDIEWIHPQSQTVTIEVAWQRSGQAGRCGPPRAPDPNAVCIITRWEGPKLAGGDPVIGGSDFGLRAVRLSETEN